MTVSILTLALLGVGTLLVLTYLRLEEARTVIEEQTDLIDKKDTFSAAMESLLSKASEFDGVKVGELVPQDAIQLLASRAYNDRWDSAAMTGIIADVADQQAELETVLATAAEQASTNESGSTYEAVIDKLGNGFVVTSIDNADKLCKEDVLGCVIGEDPYTVHIDKADSKLEFMTKFIRQGLSYHEFAHVLQFTNPVASDTAAEAFGGNWERMADCFALTYLKGWKLHHTVFVSEFEYYEVDVGYGYTCNSKQKGVIRDWYEGLGYTSEPVTP